MGGPRYSSVFPNAKERVSGTYSHGRNFQAPHFGASCSYGQIRSDRRVALEKNNPGLVTEFDFRTSTDVNATIVRNCQLLIRSGFQKLDCFSHGVRHDELT